jgi:hypothetical protein
LHQFLNGESQGVVRVSFSMSMENVNVEISFVNVNGHLFYSIKWWCAVLIALPLAKTMGFFSSDVYMQYF